MGSLLGRAAKALAWLMFLAFVIVHPASAATPHAERASLGSWHARFTYLKSGGLLPSYSGLHITVLHGGTLVLDAPVTSPQSGSPSLGPGGFGSHSSVQFRDLDGDSTPELVLSLYTGGAHCCSLDQVFDFSYTTPHQTEINFADSGASLTTINGRVVFKTRDDSFAYVFTDFADSGFPIVLWAYRKGRFLNVTANYPAAIRKDAIYWWKTYRKARRQQRDVRGVLAAWAADEARLHKAASVKTTLLQLAFDGTLDRGYGGPKGSTYVRSLWRFLRKEHYLP